MGLFREDKPLAMTLLGTEEMVASVWAQVEKRMPVREKIATSFDLPLSAPAKRVLLFAAQEARDYRPIH